MTPGPFARCCELIAEARRAGFQLGDHSVTARVLRGERARPRHEAFAADVTREVFWLLDEREAA